MVFKFETNQEFPTKPGIYKLTNKINGKVYIGQAKDLRKRLYSHVYTFKRGDNKRMILYKAISKYGSDNFSVEILETLEEYNVSILDSLESKYIAEFNSFGEHGYNQTAGGDGGVLGYRHTEETLKRMSEITKNHYKEIHSDKSLWPRAKNWQTGEEFTACTIVELEELIGISRDPVIKCINKRQNNALGIWTFARNGEEFPELILSNGGRFMNKLSINEVQQYCKEHPELTLQEIADYFHVCRKTISNYKKNFK